MVWRMLTFRDFVAAVLRSPVFLIVGLLVLAGAALLSFTGPGGMVDGFVPHRYCLVDPRLIATHAVADLVIGLAYMVISYVLFTARVWHKKNVALVIAFGAFIVTCGLTHFMEDVTLYYAVYRLQAMVKILCALMSLPTAVIVWMYRKSIRLYFASDKDLR